MLPFGRLRQMRILAVPATRAAREFLPKAQPIKALVFSGAFVAIFLNSLPCLTSGTERLVRSHHDFQLSKKRPYNVNFHSQATSKWSTDPLRTRHVTYSSLPVDDFGYRAQIIFRGVGQRCFLVCSQKDSRLTHP